MHRELRTFQAKMFFSGKLKNIYAMLIGDILIIAENRNSRRNPTKVVCLDGLSMDEVRDQNGYGIILKHRD